MATVLLPTQKAYSEVAQHHWQTSASILGRRSRPGQVRLEIMVIGPQPVAIIVDLFPSCRLTQAPEKEPIL